MIKEKIKIKMRIEDLERSEKDLGRICSSCDSEIYLDNIGDIECKCGDLD